MVLKTINFQLMIYIAIFLLVSSVQGGDSVVARDFFLPFD